MKRWLAPHHDTNGVGGIYRKHFVAIFRFFVFFFEVRCMFRYVTLIIHNKPLKVLNMRCMRHEQPSSRIGCASRLPVLVAF